MMFLKKSLYSHTGGAGGVVGDKFVVVAGKGFSGKLSTHYRIFGF